MESSEGQDWIFQARLKFSSEIENLKRDLFIFLCLGPQGLIKLRVGERQGIAQKGVRAIGPRNTAARTGENAAKTSVRAPRWSADLSEHPFVSYFGASWEGVKIQAMSAHPDMTTKSFEHYFM